GLAPSERHIHERLTDRSASFSGQNKVIESRKSFSCLRAKAMFLSKLFIRKTERFCDEVGRIPEIFRCLVTISLNNGTSAIHKPVDICNFAEAILINVLNNHPRELVIWT